MAGLTSASSPVLTGLLSSAPTDPAMSRTAFCLLLLLTACRPAAQADEQQLLLHFENRIRPVLAASCWSCHSHRRGRAEGGLALDQPETLHSGGDRGQLISTEQPLQSLLLTAIRGDDPDLQMPPKGKLDEQQIRDFEFWIQNGAPVPDSFSNAIPQDPSDPATGREHWAFQPLSQPDENALPDSPDAWSRGPIDRLIWQELQRAGLKPVHDAPPDVLIRRLSVVLLGLPPTVEQLQQYRDQPDVTTLEKLVDQMLASPAFGQRWGRHWMDLARYADSNGLDENFLFREAWRYRNWIIDAINADLPFDQFVTQQLAGDLLPWDTIEQRDRQRIATGFLVIGPKVLLGVGVDKQKMDVADEQISTIGRVFLAQTVGCARCHDHKFDPIPTADYYALAGILSSSQVMEQRYMLGQQRVMEQLVGLGQDGHDLDEAYEAYWRNRGNLTGRRDAAKKTLEILQTGDAAAIAARLQEQSESFAEAARDPQQESAARQSAQQTLVDELTRQIDQPPAIPPRAMVVTDREQPADEAIRIAGVHTDHGDRVQRGFLQVLQDSPQQLPADQSGRLQLAQWLTAPGSRAAMLTARVQANRIWHHLLGRGLVRTVDNFGRTGEQPSHPELLDYLANRLLQNNWSLKSTIREIVLSRTFALSSGDHPLASEQDPDNRLLWRAHRRRIDPESLRDAILSSAGALEYESVDSTVAYLGDQATAVGANENRRRTDFLCRTVYLPVIRNDLPEILDVFNFADPHLTTGARPQTTVPAQALYMMNSPMVMEMAEKTAARVIEQSPDASAADQLQTLYRILHSTEIEAAELQLLIEYLTPAAAAEQETVSAAEALQRRTQLLTQICHALFCSSHFQYLD